MTLKSHYQPSRKKKYSFKMRVRHRAAHAESSEVPILFCQAVSKPVKIPKSEPQKKYLRNMSRFSNSLSL